MKYYWIKERHNPQTGIYYVPCGRLTMKEARDKENTKYGFNNMLKFATEKEYDSMISNLIKKGESILKEY